MNVVVLYIDGCPSFEWLMAELQDLTCDRPDIVVSRVLVLTDIEARALGFDGWPTIQVDGFDPFPAPREFAGLSCRRYPCCVDDAGRVPGYPTKAKLSEVLQIVN